MRGKYVGAFLHTSPEQWLQCCSSVQCFHILMQYCAGKLMLEANGGESNWIGTQRSTYWSLALRCKCTWFLFNFAYDATNESRLSFRAIARALRVHFQCTLSLPWPYGHLQTIISPHSEMGPTTDSDRLTRAQLRVPAPVPLPHSRNPFQLGLRLAELIIHHFLKWTILLRGWMRWQCLAEKGSNGNMQISERAHISISHFIIHLDCIVWLVHPISSAFRVMSPFTYPPPSQTTNLIARAEPQNSHALKEITMFGLFSVAGVGVKSHSYLSLVAADKGKKPPLTTKRSLYSFQTCTSGGA